MIKAMIEKIETPSHKFEIPVEFLGVLYFDSLSLLAALMEDWDMGIAAAKAGCFLHYYDENVGVDHEFDRKLRRLHDKLWEMKKFENCDAIFSMMLYYLEPRINEIPYVDFSTRKGYFLSKDDCKKNLEYAGAYVEYEVLVEHKNNPYNLEDKKYWKDSFDATIESQFFFCSMFALGGMDLYGYRNATIAYKEQLGSLDIEKEFWGNRTEEQKSERLKKAFKAAADTIFPRDIFVYDGKKFGTYESFSSYIYPNGWEYQEWEEFAAKLLMEDISCQSFLKWLRSIGEDTVYEQFVEWKEEYEYVRMRQKPELNEPDFPVEQYIKCESKEIKERLLNGFEIKELQYYEKLRWCYDLEALQRVENKYIKLYELLCTTTDSWPWDSSIASREFQKKREAYRKNIEYLEQGHEWKRKLIDAVKSGTVKELLANTKELKEILWKGVQIGDRWHLKRLSVEEVLHLLADPPNEQ